MVKRIIIVRKDEPIVSASREAEFSIAEDTLEGSLEPEGWNFDKTYAPVPLKGRSTVSNSRPLAEGFDYRELNKPTADANVYLLRADVENETSFQSSMAKRPDVVLGYYSDLAIELDVTEHYCERPAIGNWKIVAEKLGIRNLGSTGKNIRVAIVDSGIAADDHIKVTGGWTPPQVNGNPGEWPRGHGTMCAFDVLISAPDARILDYALLKSQEPLRKRLLSDAIKCYDSLINLLRTEPGTLVVNNSWGVYDRSDDYPIGHPGNYSANIDHPYSQQVLTLIAAGADVLFSAGNCGGNCASGWCGINDIGIGRSIHGAKALPDAITVAAVTVDNKRLGYSSQGPGSISTRKPDLAAYSHFEGSGVVPARDGGDNGTSAACPVAAGVVAALREKIPNSRASTYALKAILERSAIDIDKNGWDHDIGWGIINPKGALDATS